MQNNAAGDARWMDAAARLALRARPSSAPNPAVGCILVKDGRAIARGWTQAGGRPHAEAHALGRLPDGSAEGATAYVTLEPCAHQSERGPACANLLAQARPARVLIGVPDPDPRTAGNGAALLKQAGIDVDVLESAAARYSLAGYLMRAEQGRPHVTLKIAMSLDGCIALADGTSRWITGDAARAHVHSRRALADAILVGGGTWRADKPRLDVRLPGLEERAPRKVLLSRGIAPDGVKVINSPDQIAKLEGVQYLYVEGGAEVSASFIKAGLVDRLEIYRAPIIIGDGLRAIGPLGLGDLDTAHGRWTIAETRQLGSDTFTAYQRTR